MERPDGGRTEAAATAADNGPEWRRARRPRAPSPLQQPAPHSPNVRTGQGLRITRPGGGI